LLQKSQKIVVADFSPIKDILGFSLALRNELGVLLSSDSISTPKNKPGAYLGKKEVKTRNGKPRSRA
jgi:hypothetical protein